MDMELIEKLQEKNVTRFRRNLDTIFFYDEEDRIVFESKDIVDEEVLKMFIDDDQEEETTFSNFRERKLDSIRSDEKVKQLVTEIMEKEIILNPEWQRDVVWTRKQMSSIIESILLKIPIPQLFFSENKEKNREVVDGKQRLSSVSSFLKDEYKLSGLETFPLLNGNKFSDLPEQQQKEIKNFAFSIVTISYGSNDQTKFELFSRINTGSKRLTKQEVRNAIYVKSDLLKSVKRLWSNDRDISKAFPERARAKHIEYILRAIAFLDKNIEFNRIDEMIGDVLQKYTDDASIIIEEFVNVTKKLINCFGENLFKMWNIFTDKPIFKTSLIDVFYAKQDLIRNDKFSNVIFQFIKTNNIDHGTVEAWYAFSKGLQNIKSFNLREEYFVKWIENPLKQN